MYTHGIPFPLPITAAPPPVSRETAASSASLVDVHGRTHTYLRIAVTEQCNLRCRYCMPSEVEPTASSLSHLLSDTEILRIVGILAGQGIRKVRLTGGEPLLRTDIVELARNLTAIPGVETLALTTNGVRLAHMAGALRDAGLSSVNVSLDSLQADRFAVITQRRQFETVCAGIDAALTAGFDHVKINAVIMRGVNDDELFAFADFANERDIQVRFIEYMPFAGNAWQRGGYVAGEEMRARLSTRFCLEPVSTADASVAETWKMAGRHGSLGFISALSCQFCDSCNRLRLTADGALKNCLFSDHEISLRDAIRQGASDDDVLALVRSSLHGKNANHAPVASLAAAAGRSMVRTGG
ncbi:MAG: GTP 3',8-cyclase MoaA [Bacteroidota bacterium]